MRQSASSTTTFAPDALEWPYKRETSASSRNGLRSVRTYSMAAAISRYETSGSLPSMLFDSIANALPRSEMRFSPCCPDHGVEMPHLLLVTTISIGSGFAGREDQIRQLAKSPSAVPASPPVTTVIPRPPARFCAIAVPMPIAYWASIVEVIGTTFHSKIE